MVRRKSDNAIKYVGIKENRLYWIIEEQFLCFVHIDFDCRTRKAHFGKSVASLSGDSAAICELGNLVHDPENYFLDYSTAVNDKQVTCSLAS